MRNHNPVPIAQFNGLWARGDMDSVPSDHFSDCNNIDFSQTSVFTRAPFAKAFNRLGFTPGRTVVYSNNITHKTYFLILDPIGGNLYSMQIAPITGGPILILTVPGMTDFGFVNFFGRAYISPSNGITGISGQLVQVYDGTLLWPAAGVIPAATMTVANVVLTGDIDAGYHWFGVSFLTKSGFITPFQINTSRILVPQDQFVTLSNIPTGPPGTIARMFFASKVTSALINDPNQVTFYFIDNTFGTLNDNTTINGYNITFSDNQLIEDASYLLNLAQKIDSGVFLSSYHNRLVVGGTLLDSSIVVSGSGGGTSPILTTPIVADPSTLKFSLPGDPESIDTVAGINQIDPSHSISIFDALGNTQPIGVTALQEYRDVCYVGKINKFYGLSDNGGDPSSWIPTTIDEGIGCFPHGITTILDTGGVNIDAFFVADKTGLYFFNGNFQKPEVSWKIADLWARINKTYNPTAPFSNLMHFVNDSVRKKIYISLQFEPGVMIPLSATLPEQGNGLDFSTLAAISPNLNTFEPNSQFTKKIQTATIAGGFVNQQTITNPPPITIPDPAFASSAFGNPIIVKNITVQPPPVITNNAVPFNLNTGVIPNIILVCDYQNANITTGLYTTPLYTVVRWSKWVFNTTQYSPAALILYDDGSKVNFFMFNLVDQLIYVFNGSDNQKELIANPYFDTALLGDNEDSVNHFGSIKMILKSDGVSIISPIIINRDNTRINRLRGLKISSNSGYEPTFLANMNAQKAKIRVQTNDGGTFNISKLIAYLKPVWSSLPQ